MTSVRGRGRTAVTIALASMVLVFACDTETLEDTEPRGASFPLQQPPHVQQVPAPLPGAHCSINVEGQGVLDMETDYLPHVIQCENGGANLEALKAQAIAARSVAYYAIETSGGICDSQGCQVYGCGATPSALAHQAVEETSGQYLMYNSTLTYGFYVAGDNNTSPPSCVGVSGATEGWVTYNEGQTGTSVEQTALGFIHDPADFGYGQNRGCMSQWGARCLENDNGYDYLGILRFYYGDDIQIEQGQGACVIPPDEPGSTGTPPDPSAGSDESTGGIDPSGSEGGPPPDPTTVGDGDPPPGGTAGGSGPFDEPDGTAGGADGPALPTTFGEDSGGGGCACRSASSPRGGAWLLLPWLGLWLRRRRRAC